MRLALLIPMLFLASPAAAQPDPFGVFKGERVAFQPEPQYHRGHVPPTDEYRKAVHAEAKSRLGNKVGALPVALPAAFDCRAQGWTPPVGNQKDCGSCWAYDTCDQITCAYIKAGQFKNDGSAKLSAQYFLDKCGPPNGGCNGDWGTTVMRHAKSTGVPLESDYPYLARVGACKLPASAKLYKIDDWGFCTPGQEEGMSTTQDIKNAMMQYGVLSTAIAANGDWDVYRGGVMPYRRLTAYDVNHEVTIVAWDDAKSVPGTSTKGAFLIRNSWSTAWGDRGYAWVGYGSHQIGTEAIWVTVPGAPTPPGPTPPGPVPPSPNGFTGTVTTTTTETYKGGLFTGKNTTTTTTAVTPVIVVGDEHLVADLTGVPPIRRAILKRKIVNLLEDSPACDYRVDGHKIYAVRKVAEDGSHAIDWAGFADFIAKIMPLILKLIELFGGLGDEKSVLPSDMPGRGEVVWWVTAP